MPTSPIRRAVAALAAAALSGCADSTAPPAVAPVAADAPPAAAVAATSAAFLAVRDLELRVSRGLADQKLAESLRTDLSALADAVGNDDARRVERLVARVRDALADYATRAPASDAADRDALALTLDTFFLR